MKGKKPPHYNDLARFESAEGIVGIISQNSLTGMLTFGVFKEFVRNGKVERSVFIPADRKQAYDEMYKNHIEPKLAEIMASLEVQKQDAAAKEAALSKRNPKRLTNGAMR